MVIFNDRGDNKISAHFGKKNNNLKRFMVVREEFFLLWNWQLLSARRILGWYQATKRKWAILWIIAKLLRHYSIPSCKRIDIVFLGREGCYRIYAAYYWVLHFSASSFTAFPSGGRVCCKESFFSEWKVVRCTHIEMNIFSIYFYSELFIVATLKF